MEKINFKSETLENRLNRNKYICACGVFHKIVRVEVLREMNDEIFHGFTTC